VSFRTRLTLFFLLIVVAPMLGAGLLVAELQRQSQIDEADARLSTALHTARTVYQDAPAVDPVRYAHRVTDLTGLGVVVRANGETIASDARVPGDDTRSASAPLTPSRIVTITTSVESAGALGSHPLVGAALVLFFAVALTVVIVLVRRLQGQVESMLDVARRIGAGDFSREVPVEGDDEMAGLAREMNRMSGQLSSQIEQMRSQRVELEESVRRIGEAFAHGLDREALLELVAETALSACDAQSCRIVLSGRTPASVHAGVESTGKTETLAELLVSIHEGRRRLGEIEIARGGPAFDARERDLFRYLATQAAASVENLELHEILAEQAVTDDLTGLSNKRRFTELIAKEVSRASRFDHPISLLMLDIDDFKQVNDTHGHLKGDEVLRRIGRILLEESRGVDEAARYGGEEFVLALPETGATGALEVAERVRARVESARIPLDGESGEIGVTVSVGVATLTGAAADAHSLIASADAALYVAKRNGKNGCMVAPASAPPRAPTPQGRAPQRRT